MKLWILRMVVGLALAGHLAAAAGYWWLSPKGFPIDSSRFWLNSVVPILLIAVACAGLVGIPKSRWQVAAAVVLFLASAWCAGAISGRVIFPISLRGIWVMALFIGGAGFVCFLGLVRDEPRSYRIWLLSSAAAMFVGWFAIWAQIPPPASTAPINAQPREVIAQGVSQAPESLQVSGGYQFDATAAELMLDLGKIRIRCCPPIIRWVVRLG